MAEDTPRPQIDASKLRIGGGIAGIVVTLGSMLIFLIGIPMLRYIFPVAILLGCGVAVFLRFIRHETPGAPWLLSATDKANEAPPEREPRAIPGRSTRIFLGSPAVT
jgi:hypothetical protein